MVQSQIFPETPPSSPSIVTMPDSGKMHCHVDPYINYRYSTISPVGLPIPTAISQRKST